MFLFYQRVTATQDGYWSHLAGCVCLWHLCNCSVSCVMVRNGGMPTVCAVWESPILLTLPTSHRLRTPSPVRLMLWSWHEYTCGFWRVLEVGFNKHFVFVRPVWAKLKSLKASERWQPDTEVSTHSAQLTYIRVIINLLIPWLVCVSGRVRGFKRKCGQQEDLRGSEETRIAVDRGESNF